MNEKWNQNKLLTFKSLYNSYATSLIRFSSQFVDIEVAEDLVQDIFLDLWEHKDITKIDCIKTYLFTAVRNRCINYLNRIKVSTNYINSVKADIKLLGLDYYDTEERRIVEKEALLKIYEEINQLPEKCREIFKLAYFNSKRSLEIAELLNISERTVEHQLYLGLRKLRCRLLKNKKE